MKKFDLILLVDDDSISTYMARFFLEEIGFSNNTHDVPGGEEACEFLASNKMELIFLDINMPILNGFEFIEKAKNLGVLGDSKIIVLSSSQLKEDVDKASSFEEVMGYIVKPLRKEKIEIVMKKFDDTEVMDD
ncbi:MAG: response regulator [Flavobacteriales bacterium]|nr:response regulator [Flavobacteriales bacterium]